MPAALVLQANRRFLGFDYGYLRNQYSCYTGDIISPETGETLGNLRDYD
jgi:hypothetical protein